MEAEIIRLIVTLAGGALAAIVAIKLERMRSANQLDAGRRLEMFKLAAPSLDAASKILHRWMDALDDYDKLAFGKGKEAFYEQHAGAVALARDARQTGFFIPPALDDLYDATLDALDAATKLVARSALDQGGSEKLVRDRYDGLVHARAKVGEFQKAVRTWKRSEWLLDVAPAPPQLPPARPTDPEAD
jgi:hypothetical protein